MTSENGSEDSEFWADRAAEKVIENGRNPVVKGGVSPSGVPHIGNFNEVLRGHFVTRALEDVGEDATQIFTRDDRDPFRSVPYKLADENGNIVELDDETRAELENHLGKPYVDDPDPFGCCDSWADHFGSILEDSADALDVEVEFYSNHELYDSGELLDITRTVLSDVEKAREVIARFQRTVGDDYIPFMPICAEC
ncbi:MAG: lysine--tRNA ligase, partial [Halobacteria archaeon]|nr:lysine--tRNA ligase [Halobacteria archaeon]